MTFRFLQTHLWPTAEIVASNYLGDELGLTSVKIEESIDKDIEFRPVLSVRRKDHHVVCVDVSDTPMPDRILRFVLQCQHQHFPALLYVAYPSGGELTGLESQLALARASGVGILAVDHEVDRITVLNTPLSLSLSGLRGIKASEFTGKLRIPVKDAETTFRNGDPNKGCSNVYDEIEDLTRRVAIRVHKKGYVTKQLPNPEDLSGKMPWASILTYLRANLSREAAKADGRNLDQLTDVMLNRLIGITAYRNDSNHKPRSMRALRERDSRLRTRMEDAVDALKDLSNATKSLKA